MAKTFFVGTTKLGDMVALTRFAGPDTLTDRRCLSLSVGNGNVASLTTEEVKTLQRQLDRFLAGVSEFDDEETF